ncbi:MAG: MFS transporter [Anaerolineae bacterium]|nr:MFS transporter [Anaerolineae bacterium]
MEFEAKTPTAREADETFDRSLIAALVAIFILRTASGAMGVLVSLYLKSLGVSGTVAGLFSAAFYAVELVASPVFGAWSDRHGRKWFMMLGPIFGGIAVVITALTAHIPVLFFTRLLEGLSAASSVPSALSYISDASDRSVRLRGRVVSLFEIATMGGLALGGVIAGVMWDRVGRVAFAYDALIYLVSLAIFAWGVSGVREIVHSASQHSALRDYIRLFRDPHLLSFAPAWLAVNAILGVWVNLLPFLMSGHIRDPHQNLMGGFSGTVIGLVLATFIFVFAGGILIWGFFFSQVSRARVMLLGGVGLLFGIAAAYGINHLPIEDTTILGGLLFVLLVSLFMESGFTPAALGYLADLSTRFPAHRGAIMGLYSVLLALGQSLGTGIGGRFADWRGVDGIILWTLILNGIAIVCVLILGRLPDEQARGETTVELSTHQ